MCVFVTKGATWIIYIYVFMMPVYTQNYIDRNQIVITVFDYYGTFLFRSEKLIDVNAFFVMPEQSIDISIFNISI